MFGEECLPYHTIPYQTIPYQTIPYHTIPYHTILYRTAPYHTIPANEEKADVHARYGRERQEIRVLEQQPPIAVQTHGEGLCWKEDRAPVVLPHHAAVGVLSE